MKMQFAAAAMLVVSTAVGAGQAEAAGSVPCRVIVHRAVAPETDEEQPLGVKYAKRFRWGAEIDARLSADGTPWAIHDAGLGRITGGKDKRKVIALTDDQLRAVTLVHGGRPRTLAAMMRAGAKYKARLLVELKPVPPGAPVRWASAPSGEQTGLDRLAAATVGRITWTTSRPDVWDSLKADDRFNGRLSAKPWAWDPDDPESLAGLVLAYLGPDEVTAANIAVVKAAGVTPLKHVHGVKDTRKAMKVGLTYLVSHYPAATSNICSG